MLDKAKKLHKSWTIWFNGIAMSFVYGLPQAKDAFPALHDYIPANWYQHGMAAVIIANILLRFKTDKPLEQK